MAENKITKVLVANRSEIAVRVMRTCRDMEIATVAVFSDVDRKALHVRYATEAYHIGPAPSPQSYLDIDKIIEVAKKSGADAVHPGYGFLSENPEFARRLAKEGIILIGPSADSMEAMATKTNARKIMQDAGVPVVPGLVEAVAREDEAQKFADDIGYPVMLKAAAGGGGRGLRKIDLREQFHAAWEATRSEAKNSFGDDAVYIEKYLDKPRHIEMQVMADAYGTVRVFPERECSVQRRHQKVIEESPSPFVNAAMRKQMADVATRAARAVNYLGAGTIEFLVDASHNFYFMEMNTRLQVEHPVTEMVTGHDLVRMQIHIAEGKKLVPDKNDLVPHGWSIEARVCAEDPDHDFVPTPGAINHFRQPGGPFVRTDTGIYAGVDVPLEYDSMIAKVISWGNTRSDARWRLDRALSEFTIKGFKTNTMFLRELLRIKAFQKGVYDTSLVDCFMRDRKKWYRDDHKLVALIGTALFAYEKEQELRTRVKVDQEASGPTGVSAWRRALAGRARRHF